MLLEVLHTCFWEHRLAVAMVARVGDDCNYLPIFVQLLWDESDFFGIHNQVLKLMWLEFVLFIFADQSDFNRLLSVNFISVFREALLNFDAAVSVRALNVVGALCFQPAVSPFSEIQLAVGVFGLDSVLETLDHIVKHGILVFKALHVELASFLEHGSTNKVVHGFKPSCTFSVWNFVEGCCCLTCMLNLNANRVSAWLQISFDRQRVVLIPDLVNTVKDFRILFVHFLSKGDTTKEISETFLQPEIIPPNHCCQVTKPHMGKLV